MKHLKSRKHHSKAFRKDAVELLLTGRTLHDLAGELGVSAMTLYRWKEEYLLELANSPPDTANLPPLKMQEELQRLRKVKPGKETVKFLAKSLFFTVLMRRMIEFLTVSWR